jgi:hypothetical protein
MDDHDSRTPTVIRFDGFDNPLFLFEEFLEFRRLAIAEFEHKASAWLKEIRAFAGESAVKVEPVRTAVEGEAGIMVANLGLKGGDFRAGDVGRIGDDEVETGSGRHGGEAVAGEELDAGIDGVSDGVLAGEREGPGGDIQGGDLGGGAFDGESDGQTAGAGAEVEGG